MLSFENPALKTENLQVYYGDHHAFFDGNLEFEKNKITALIGPSGCGKSTFLRSSSSPRLAWSTRLRPSAWKGRVTMPTVRIPRSRAALAMTGAAPVPVPPPMPAVTNTILVPSCSKRSTMSSRLSIAACRPLLGSLPAPSPSPS